MPGPTKVNYLVLLFLVWQQSLSITDLTLLLLLCFLFLGKPSKVWVTNLRPPGTIYGKDSIQVIPKLKGKTAKKLAVHDLNFCE